MSLFPTIQIWTLCFLFLQLRLIRAETGLGNMITSQPLHPTSSTYDFAAVPLLHQRSVANSTLHSTLTYTKTLHSTVSSPRAPTVTSGPYIPPSSLLTGLTTCEASYEYNVTTIAPAYGYAYWSCFTTFRTTSTMGTLIYVVNTRLNLTSVRTEYASGFTTLTPTTTTTATLNNVTIAYPTQYTFWPTEYTWDGILPCLVNNATDSCYTTVGGITPMTSLPAAVGRNQSYPVNGDSIGTNCALMQGDGLYPFGLPQICNIAPLPHISMQSVGMLGVEVLQQASYLVVRSTSFIDDSETSSSSRDSRTSSEATASASAFLATPTTDILIPQLLETAASDSLTPKNTGTSSARTTPSAIEPTAAILSSKTSQPGETTVASSTASDSNGAIASAILQAMGGTSGTTTSSDNIPTNVPTSVPTSVTKPSQGSPESSSVNGHDSQVSQQENTGTVPGSSASSSAVQEPETPLVSSGASQQGSTNAPVILTAHSSEQAGASASTAPQTQINSPTTGPGGSTTEVDINTYSTSTSSDAIIVHGATVSSSFHTAETLILVPQILTPVSAASLAPESQGTSFTASQSTTIGSLIATPKESAYVIAGQTLAPGSEITISSTRYSLDSSATAVVVDGTTSQIAAPSSHPVTQSSLVAIPQESGYVIVGQTLAPGSEITVSSTRYSLGSSATALVVDDSTFAIAPQSSSPPVSETSIGSLIATIQESGYIIAGQTLAPGAEITISNTKYSLDSAATAVVVNGVTSGIVAPSSQSFAQTSVGAFVATPTDSGYVIAGQTLAPGSEITISNTKYSLDSSATAVVINGMTSAIAAPNSHSPSEISVGSLVATPASSGYVVAGQTLAPGSALTISGTAYSLDSSATAVVVDGVTSAISSNLLSTSTISKSGPGVTTTKATGTGGGSGSGSSGSDATALSTGGSSTTAGASASASSAAAAATVGSPVSVGGLVVLFAFAVFV